MKFESTRICYVVFQTLDRTHVVFNVSSEILNPTLALASAIMVLSPHTKLKFYGTIKSHLSSLSDRMQCTANQLYLISRPDIGSQSCCTCDQSRRPVAVLTSSQSYYPQQPKQLMPLVECMGYSIIVQCIREPSDHQLIWQATPIAYIHTLHNPQQ